MTRAHKPGPTDLFWAALIFTLGFLISIGTAPWWLELDKGSSCIEYGQAQTHTPQRGVTIAVRPCVLWGTGEQ